VQANEIGLHAVGVDVSVFNTLISNVKITQHDIDKLRNEITRITSYFLQNGIDDQNVLFEAELIEELKKFNKEYYPSPEFKRMVRIGEIDERAYSADLEKKIVTIYNDLVSKHGVKIHQSELVSGGCFKIRLNSFSGAGI